MHPIDDMNNQLSNVSKAPFFNRYFVLSPYPMANDRNVVGSMYEELNARQMTKT